MKKFLSNLSVLAIVSVALLAILPVYAMAEQATATLNKKQLHGLEATAKTPAEHRTIAAYYQQQAQTFTTKSAEYAAMAEHAAKGQTPTDAKTAVGYRVVISGYRYFAKQYAEEAGKAVTLAVAHEEMATKAEQQQL